ncbi:MAG: sialidase [Planctomycetota bacterium]|nr:sialidase [Planctomycetota bacterium]
MRTIQAVLILLLLASLALAASDSPPPDLLGFFTPPPQYANDFGAYKSPLVFADGHAVKAAADWQDRRQEILKTWHELMGPWPTLLEKPRLEYVESVRRENFTQHRIRLETAANQMAAGYLLVPEGEPPFPAVLVVFYDPETSIGIGKAEFRDFAYQLSRREFVTLAIGSPGGDAWKPDSGGARCQPLSFLGYVAANCHTALSQLTCVDRKRIGVVGHSYGGKWAMFASCLYDRFAAAAWSDPGIVFDESRPNVNYWEPWYLGDQPGVKRKPGVPSRDNPRTGPYKTMIETGHDLHELHALMAPRPLLISGGSEDPPSRWRALNHTVAVNRLLGYTNRVAMTNRAEHNPSAESNEQIYLFFQSTLGRPAAR